VREKVERLGGRVGIMSRPGEGTTIEMLLPLSLATFRGVVVRAGVRFFVVPTLNVTRVLRVRRDSVQSIENRPAIEHQGRSTPVVPLGRVLGLPELEAHETEGTWLSLVILLAGGAPIALAVDEVCHEQDVLVKPLGRELDELRGVVGATVLASGKIAPILEAGELTRRALQIDGIAFSRSGTAPEAQRKRSILVAEDSITSRTLLKSILEGAGFSVVTAVDGADAFAKLKTGSFDLVVSDVDMPRLNGLGLTQKIRADKALSEVPVVLVTSLESREDRERGVDVGASAYIVKRSFEQSNLLDAIQRLL
jgi:two-component system chemotaxis sensor kinase CheA